MATRKRPAKASRKGGAKPAKARKEKKAKEPKEVKPGPPVEVVVSILTGVILLMAIVLVDYSKGRLYGTGLFFSGQYQSDSGE